MKLIVKDGRRYILRFDFGEEFIETLKSFCTREGILSGFFTCIGAASEVNLNIFHLNPKSYSDQTFKEELEVVDLTGNISKTGENVTIHAHGSFGRADYSVIGGHVKKLVASVTLEIHLISIDGKIERKLDPKTGLNLMA